MLTLMTHLKKGLWETENASNQELISLLQAMFSILFYNKKAMVALYCSKGPISTVVWRNGLSWAISPFLTVFSKDLSCRHVKTRACLGKG